jgi:TetR/AcrR family tetracycline transcriptional repressor
MDRRHRERFTVEQLEHHRELVNRRLDDQRARINARLDREKAKLSGELSPKQQEIVGSALELLDAAGLDNLSLRALAQRLDVRAPALYWHFKNKESLVEHMAEAILRAEFKNARPRPEGEDWQDWLTLYTSRLRKAMLARRDGGRVVAGAHLYPAVTLIQWFEDSLMALTSAGVDVEKAWHIVRTVSLYTFGYVIEEQAGPTREERTRADLLAFVAQYPHVAAAMQVADESGTDAEEDFLVGLGYIMKGSAKA